MSGWSVTRFDHDHLCALKPLRGLFNWLRHGKHCGEPPFSFGIRLADGRAHFDMCTSGGYFALKNLGLMDSRSPPSGIRCAVQDRCIVIADQV